MRHSRAVLASALAAASFLPAIPGEALAQEQVQIEEWDVPWERSRPRDPYVAPDGKVWFVGQTAHYVAHLDPASGAFEKIDLEDGAGPHNLVVAADGTIWYAGNAARHIGRVDAATGKIQKFMMPDERARDPHTLVFDSEGDLWFSVQGGNFVGHFDTETGDTKLVEAPRFEGPRGLGASRPYGIVVDSRDHAWVALFNSDMIGTVDPETMALRTYELPEGSRPRRLVVDSRDVVWYVDYQQGQLGRLDPSSGEVKEWDLPGGAESRPYAMAIDPDDRIWAVETPRDKPNRFVGFDPRTEKFFSVTEIPSGGGTVRHMYYDREHNVVWFGTDTNKIGRARLPPLTGRGVS